MAAINRVDIQKRLMKLNRRFSLIEECLDLDGPFTLPRSIRSLKRRQQILKRQFYDLLAPFYQGNIESLYFHEVPYLVFPVVVGSGTDKEAELVVLAQRLEVFEKLADERLEVIDDWITDVEVSERIIAGIAIKESDDDIQGKLFLLFDCKKEKLSYLAKLVDVLLRKVRKEKRLRVGKTQETDRVLSLKDVARQLYGFSISIANDIGKSLRNRKQLLEDEIEFLTTEVEIVLYDYPGYSEWQEDDARLGSWNTVKNLKMKFKELKENFLYKTEEVDDQNSEPKASSEPDNEDPNLTKVKIERFPKVARFWIFHIESLLFHLVYEIIQKMSENEASETIFQGFLTKLKRLKEINCGMVPITVYKVVELMDDLLNVMTPRAEGSDSDKQQLHEKIRLSDVMDLIHGIMLRLGPVLQVNASLAQTGLIRLVELVWLEHTLEQIEEELREIERNIKGANSGSEDK